MKNRCSATKRWRQSVSAYRANRIAEETLRSRAATPLELAALEIIHNTYVRNPYVR